MNEDEQFIFIKPKDIPKLLRGGRGRNWKELFDKIPVNETLVMGSEQFGSAPNIRTRVKSYNDSYDEALKVTQRTKEEGSEKVITVYVTRISENKE